MGIVTLPSFGSDPATVTAAGLDGKVDPLANEFNGGIDNDNIASDAAIGNSKLNLATITQNITHSGTLTHSGGITMSSKQFDEAKGANVASASTTTIWVTDGNFVHITGTTTITSFGTAAQAGIERTIVFDGALTLTHNATSLILPTGANITTAAGDTAIVRAETTANARVIAYLRKDGSALAGGYTPSASNALSGSVIQMVNNTVVTSTTGTTAIPEDDTIPQNTEGDEYMTQAITPNNSSNTLIIQVVCHVSNATNTELAAALFQDSTANALAAGKDEPGAGGTMQGIVFTHKMTAGTTSATTFKVRAGGAAGTTTFNGEGGNRRFGGVLASSITIWEIKA